MVMIDATNGKVLAQVPIGTGTDSSWFDPGTKLAFSSTREGTVTVAREESPTTLRTVQTLSTHAAARTMTIDPSTHRIYPVSDFEAAVPGQPGRPKAVPETFRVLVYEMVANR